MSTTMSTHAESADDIVKAMEDLPVDKEWYVSSANVCVCACQHVYVTDRGCMLFKQDGFAQCLRRPVHTG